MRTLRAHYPLSLLCRVLEVSDLLRALVRELTELAQQTDKGLLLAGQALESLRQKRRIPRARRASTVLRRA